MFGTASWSCGQHPDFFEHFAVVFGLSFYLHGIGTAAAWHTVKAERAPVDAEGDALSYGWRCGAVALAERVGRLLPGGGHCAAVGQLAQQGSDVGRFDDVEKLVRSVALQAAYDARCIIKGQAGALGKGDDFIPAEAFGRLVDKAVLVATEDIAQYAPHVVLQVGVEEVDRPALAWWWETAQHEQACFRGEERGEGMGFGRRQGVGHG